MTSWSGALIKHGENYTTGFEKVELYPLQIRCNAS